MVRVVVDVSRDFGRSRCGPSEQKRHRHPSMRSLDDRRARCGLRQPRANRGTSLVVHAKPDDMKTDPAGNAGDRIACGVIELD